MIDERLQELASLYAFDLLEGSERIEFESRLGRDLELRRLVDELRGTAAKLAHTAPAQQPPESLKRRILETIDAGARGSEQGHGGEVLRSPFSLGGLVPWAVAAALAFSVAWLGERYVASRSENSLLRQEAKLAELTLAGSRADLESEKLVVRRAISDYRQLQSESGRELAESRKSAAEAERRLADADARAVAVRAELASLNDGMKREVDLARLKIAMLASMLHNSPEAVAVAVWDPTHKRGVFTVDKLPANSPDQRYELWVIDSKPVSAGVFSVGPDGHALLQFRPVLPVSKVAKFAVSRERNDGLRAHAAPTDVVMISE